MKGIFRSMGLAMKHALRREITIQYPDEKRKMPPRFRGALAIRGAIDEQTERHVTPSPPPCQKTCPAGVAVREQNTLVAEGKIEEAFRTVQESNIIPGALGRICHHPCETQCTRGLYDQSIAIRPLHRVISDGYLKSKAKPAPFERKSDDKVAIIGAGPSGLAAAYDLLKAGYGVTLFEKEKEPGGMLSMGVPRYRLPRNVLQAEIADVVAYGAELKCGVEVGKDISFADLKEGGFKAVLIAAGLQISRGLPLPGNDLDGVMLAMPFLKAVNYEEKVDIGKKVVVIGGGNVAVDVARCARRLGSEVKMVCLESEPEIPAHSWEIEEAEEEGVDIRSSRGPKVFIGKGGKLTGVEFMECLSVFDSEGRFAPECDEDKVEVFDADNAIISIGQGSELQFLDDSGVGLNERGQLEYDETTLETSGQGVFACGEVVTGPSSCIGSISSGHHAAVSIIRFLRGEDLREGRAPFDFASIKPFDWDKHVHKEINPDGTGKKYHTPPEPLSKWDGFFQPLLPYSRRRLSRVDADERLKNFEGVEIGLDDDGALIEAWRCLRCESGKCVGCTVCARVCPTEAISQTISQNGYRRIEEFSVDLRLCVFCGICSEHCPTSTLYHSLEYELSVADDSSLVYNKERLLRDVPEEFYPSSDELPEDKVTKKLYRWYK